AGAAPSASESSADIARRAGVLRAVRSAEYVRSSSALPDDALGDHDVVVRRAAARALSRIADPHAVELLGKALSDEDGEVVAGPALHSGGPERAFAIAAMTATGAAGADALRAPLNDDKAPKTERALAAAALGRIGNAGRPVLEAALGAMAPASASLDRAFLDR